jgi:hypothetical protein
MMTNPIRIVSSEIRYRHRDNITETHMGGPIDARNRYVFSSAEFGDSQDERLRRRSFDLLNVRVLYALHELPVENGPLCVVPGSHKANYQSPYGKDPLREPGMIALPMEPGDALFFSENLRHGGFPNVLDRVRKTIHMCYAPEWVTSQSPAHWNDTVHVTDAAWSRYSDGQRTLLPPPGRGEVPTPDADASPAVLQTIKRLRYENALLMRKNADLENDLTCARQGLARLVTYRLKKFFAGSGTDRQGSP